LRPPGSGANGGDIVVSAVQLFLANFHDEARFLLERLRWWMDSEDAGACDCFNATCDVLDPMQGVAGAARDLLGRVHSELLVGAGTSPSAHYAFEPEHGLHKGDVLLSLVRTLGRHGRSVRVVEIGVSHAENTDFLLRHSVDIAAYFGVDPYLDREDALEVAQSVYKRYPQAELLRETSAEALSRFDDRSLDLVFVDGDHSYGHCKHDVVNWGRKVRPGGVLCGHDFALEFPGCVQAVLEEIPAGQVLRLGGDATWWWFVPPTQEAQEPRAP